MSDPNARRPVFARWTDAVPEDVRPGVRRRAFGTDDVMLVMNEIAPRMVPAPHVHESFDQIALVLSGRAVFHVGDESFAMEPGSIVLVPAGMEHWIEPDGDEPVHNLDVFAPAREDFLHLLEWMGTRQ